MSGYDKKYIKGEHKKECFKKEEEKDYCKKDYCEEDHYEEEEKGIYTELQVNEAVILPTPGNIPDTPQVTTLPPLTQIARKTICVDDKDDRVLINGTIEWAPQGIATAGVGVAVLGALFAIPASFRVWRKSRSSFNTIPELIYETTDASPLASFITLTPPTASFGLVTTSFHFVDEDAPVGENEYILTMEPAIAGITGILPAIIALLVGFLLPGLTFNNATTSYVFTLAEIEENE